MTKFQGGTIFTIQVVGCQVHVHTIEKAIGPLFVCTCCKNMYHYKQRNLDYVPTLKPVKYCNRTVINFCDKIPVERSLVESTKVLVYTCLCNMCMGTTEML